MTFDKQLQRELLQELNWDPSLDATRIGVSVQEGEVRLTGSVSSHAEKLVAEEVVHRVRGVLAVTNELEVKTADIAPAPSAPQSPSASRPTGKR
jgi:osmotically-inducible protein OsmY